MKKLINIVLSLITICNIGTSQLSEEAIMLSNSLSDLWYEGKTDIAVKNSIKLHQLYPPLLIDVIHNTLALQIENETNHYGKIYLEQLHIQNNKEINEIIEPLYIYCKTINSNRKDETEKLKNDLINIISDSLNLDTKAERYNLLTLQELKKQNVIEDSILSNLLKINIDKLEKYKKLNIEPNGRSESEIRAWHRHVLSINYHFLFQLNTNNEEYLRKAAIYSPDYHDNQVIHSFFYDSVLLTGKTEDFGFRNEYKDYLHSNNRINEYQEMLLEIAFTNPTDSNIKSLEEHYLQSERYLPFIDYWHSHINSKGKHVPEGVISSYREVFNFSDMKSWIYIDFWGTWCEPCIEELPELQEFYQENNKNKNSNLKIYTFSFNSKNLDEFMAKNEYTFPVKEIESEISDLFQITGYPTKILISPTGKYIKIPFGVDWKEYIMNYSQISE